MENTLEKTINHRSKMSLFESVMLKTEGVVVGHDSEKICPIGNFYADGMYIRKIFMPKGMVLTSKIHKVEHPYFILEGEVDVITEEGTVNIKAPYFGITPAGTKRAIQVKEDCTWITCHLNPTNTRDLEVIEGNTIAKDFKEIDNIKPDLIQGKDIL